MIGPIFLRARPAKPARLAALTAATLAMMAGLAQAAEGWQGTSTIKPATPLQPIRIEVSGRVARPGTQRLPADARLFDATQAAGVRADAYLAGAAWLRPSAREKQQALKAGLLHELMQAQQQALRDEQGERASLLSRLHAEVSALQVSGRVTTVLDPVRLELEAQLNHRLADGDRLLYPPRPDSVTVSGAVQKECRLPFVGLRPAADYLRDCPAHGEADPDWLIVIQPDGKVSRHGIAAWNRNEGQPLAPGARLLLPLRGASAWRSLLAAQGVADDEVRSLNAELAAFLATQPLPAAASVDPASGEQR
ncbi:capsule biosynthesis GfcC family protein [Rhodocyclus purpureus]|uniref:capsule biosynthesis GfcC family protein n=1 Tax=Rhodocyclus purpureus TaxID=1067 RepID=UPI0019122BBD|nr:capsule biosynthesis GfcC family protein [Rhodocyclus purpureus]MBK5914527.1 hypothetical protein [Rhodocyclus purpureus]